MSLPAFAIRQPYAMLALALTVAVLGVFGYLRTPVDLFPESAPPQVLVITRLPGAAADDVADKITEIIEKELQTLSGLKNITSTSRDQVSSIRAEFFYSKPAGEAVVDVSNAIARIRAELPAAAMEPAVHRITEAGSRPLLTLALSPRPGGMQTLGSIRLLAENQIREIFLRVAGIADVEVFGAHAPEVHIRLDRDAMAARGIGLGEVLAAVAQRNISVPAGLIYDGPSEYLVRASGEFEGLEPIRALPIRRTGDGFVSLEDIGAVELGEAEPRSRYHGNGREAIALNLLRPDGGKTVEAIEAAKRRLPELQVEFPDIRFEITDDQAPLIELNLSGMRDSIVQAIFLTVLVIFLFLADMRAAAVAAVSIPLAFLVTLAVLWGSPHTLNMITLSGIIVAIGMVVDGAVVSIENIVRVHRENPSMDPSRAAKTGADQIALPITAGMLTTVAVLLPVMFIGGYPQRTIGTLSMVIAVTLIAALGAALGVVPPLGARLLRRSARSGNRLERLAGHTDHGVNILRDGYLRVLRLALRHRWVTLGATLGFLVLTVRLVPGLIGGELMPPMDTGIVNVAFTTPATDSPEQVARVLEDVESVIQGETGVIRISSVAGSEPGAVSFGAGGATTQSVLITVHLVDRTQRSATIWEIQDRWRDALRKIPGIQSFHVTEYGATPMATTKAPLDIIISGPDPAVLDALADRALLALDGMPGLVDVRRAWFFDERERDIAVDPFLALDHGVSTAEVAADLQAAVQGVTPTRLRLESFLDIPVRVQYRQADLDDPDQLSRVFIQTPSGPVPLRALATINENRTRPFTTREALRPTIDITGVNHTYTIQHVAKEARRRLDKLDMPRDYTLEIAGSASDMADTNARLRGALVVGLALLYLLLLAMFRSFTAPLVVLAAVPPAIAGALWGLLLFDKPMSMPGSMGMIFLGGTIINNSILLLDFIQRARASGASREDAILDSVRLRLRPVLMTTASTVVGLFPLVFELAVGLERMSPLGIVAASGLIVGTLITLVLVPVVYDTLDRLGPAARMAARTARTTTKTTPRPS